MVGELCKTFRTAKSCEIRQERCSKPPHDLVPGRNFLLWPPKRVNFTAREEEIMICHVRTCSGTLPYNCSIAAT